MQNYQKIFENLFYVGGNDYRLALFESAFPVPRGVSYNSYLLVDEKTVLFDTVDLSVADTFFENVERALGGRTLDYLIVHHVEPDHSASFARLLELYPEVTVVTNAKAVQMLKNFFSFDATQAQIVKEGDVLQTGKHSLQFIFAPLVHWPEVMMSFEQTTGTLFSADAFGAFGALSGSIFADEVQFERDYLDDARRYYFNIVGKYGAQVQNVLKKASALQMNTICPLHGPIWRKNLAWYLGLYQTWSAYEAEEKGVALFYGSIYGHTKNAVEILAKKLVEEGVTNVRVYDVSHTEPSILLAEAFRYSHAVFASVTYNNGIFVNMAKLLHDLSAHAYQNRKFALIENGSWAPQAGKLMKEQLSALKNMQQIGETVTVLSSLKQEDGLIALAKQIADSVREEISSVISS